MLRLYNTLTKKKEAFVPLDKKIVTMYNCGPTVYDYAHVGNFRAYLFADLLRRYLEHRGYTVKQIMNITDVGHMTHDEEADSSGEDKIEKKAKQQKKSPKEIAEFYTNAFFEDVEVLGIKKATRYPKASEHVAEMITIIEKLIKKNHAYEIDGCVYYSVESFAKYGKLSGNTIKNLMAGKRIDVRSDKKNPFDFALWVRNPNHIMQWNSPWGKGYPGWHIECSAMSLKYLKDTFDIHTGGEDNIFPHHECEIAQSEGFTGKRFVKYWLHVRHLQINDQKMSKSLGNFYTIRDLIKKNFTPQAIRYFLLSANYRTTLNLTEDGIRAADETVTSIEHFIRELKQAHGKENKKIEALTTKTKKRFEAAMDDDLNTARALSEIFTFMTEINKFLAQKHVSKKNAKTVLTLIESVDSIFGLTLGKTSEWKPISKASKEIRDLITQREEARKKKEWKVADSVRLVLKKKGIIIEDTEKGPRWREQ